jgi:Uma2 family endonuclease
LTKQPQPPRGIHPNYSRIYNCCNQLEWFGLTDGEYQLLSPDGDGILRSQVFPGLWLAVDALLSHQMAQVLEVLQVG